MLASTTCLLGSEGVLIIQITLEILMISSIKVLYLPFLAPPTKVLFRTPFNTSKTQDAT